LRNLTHAGCTTGLYIGPENTIMIRIHKRALQPGFSGAIAKTIVVKQYADKTVITAYPDMSGIIPSPEQVTRRAAFAKAVAWAQSINNDPVQKAAWAARIGKGRSVYHAALAGYLNKIHQQD
jgi:hypothetical protein